VSTPPTLTIGGCDDAIVAAHIQREMAALIPISELVLCPGGRACRDDAGGRR
jgi:hypothetical protein